MVPLFSLQFGNTQLVLKMLWMVLCVCVCFILSVCVCVRERVLRMCLSACVFVSLFAGCLASSLGWSGGGLVSLVVVCFLCCVCFLCFVFLFLPSFVVPFARLLACLFAVLVCHKRWQCAGWLLICAQPGPWLPFF